MEMLVEKKTTFKQKVAGIKCNENLKIKMSTEFKVANCWKEREKNYLKMHLIEQKSCHLLTQLRKIPMT